MNFIIKWIVSISAITCISFGVVNNVTYQSITGRIVVSIDPSKASIGNKASDIIIVVDNSGSMATHQIRLAQQAKVMSDTLKQMQNVRVGVLSTDMDNFPNQPAGQFLKSWIDSSDLNFETKLAERIQAGSDGSGTEKPFDSVASFLSQKEVGNNSGFWRDEAALTVVVISDAADQSTIEGVPFEFAHLLFESKKSSGLPVGFHAIIVPSDADPSCARDDITATPETTEDVVGMFKGVVISLCAPDDLYLKGLEKIAKDIVNRAPLGVVPVSVPLKFIPIAQTISVQYGNLNIGENQNDGWTYDSTKNRVTFPKSFNWSSQPAGTSLEIKFELAGSI